MKIKDLVIKIKRRHNFGMRTSNRNNRNLKRFKLNVLKGGQTKW